MRALRGRIRGGDGLAVIGSPFTPDPSRNDKGDGPREIIACSLIMDPTVNMSDFNLVFIIPILAMIGYCLMRVLFGDKRRKYMPPPRSRNTSRESDVYSAFSTIPTQTSTMGCRIWRDILH
jgi:hypothetical protein